jgi:hypothetical protein
MYEMRSSVAGYLTKVYQLQGLWMFVGRAMKFAEVMWFLDWNMKSIF